MISKQETTETWAYFRIVGPINKINFNKKSFDNTFLTHYIKLIFCFYISCSVLD